MEKFQQFKVLRQIGHPTGMLKKWMKSILFTLILAGFLIGMGAGYLHYTGQLTRTINYFKTGKSPQKQTVTIYSWTDKNGVRRYSEYAPPPGAKDIEQKQGASYDDVAHKKRLFHEKIVTTVKRFWRKIKGVFD